MQRMIESRVPCKMYLFDHLRHAFLSTERLMKESNDAFKHSIDAFKQLVKRSKEEQNWLITIFEEWGNKVKYK